MDECAVCTAVAAGGRIRLTDENSFYIEGLVANDRHRLLGERRRTLDAGGDAAQYILPLRTSAQLLREIRRTQHEMKWLDGEPERSDA